MGADGRPALVAGGGVVTVQVAADLSCRGKQLILLGVKVLVVLEQNVGELPG